MDEFGHNAPSVASPAAVDELLAILREYLSPIHARSLLERSTSSRAGGSIEFLLTDLDDVLRRVKSGASLFVAPSAQTELQQRLTDFSSKHTVGSTLGGRILVRDEGDIVIARTRARSLCEQLGASVVAAHKVATVVSELARNIISYTPGGYIELEPNAASTAITVRAVDEGSGIPNLETILGGRYRSRTGLGLGLCGSRRLAQEFDIRTGPRGTEVTAVMGL